MSPPVGFVRGYGYLCDIDNATNGNGNGYGKGILPKLRNAADAGDFRHKCRWLVKRGLLHRLLQRWQVYAEWTGD